MPCFMVQITTPFRINALSDLREYANECIRKCLEWIRARREDEYDAAIRNCFNEEIKAPTRSGKFFLKKPRHVLTCTGMLTCERFMGNACTTTDKDSYHGDRSSIDPERSLTIPNHPRQSTIVKNNNLYGKISIFYIYMASFFTDGGKIHGLYF
jgi:hypothetical protein